MGITFSGDDFYTRAAAFAASEAGTVMAWARPSALPSSGGYKNTIGCHLQIVIDLHNVSGTTRWSVGTSAGDFDGTTTVSASVWYHVAVTWAAGANPAKDLYVNGVDEGGGTDSGAPGSSPNDNLVIASWNNTDTGDEFEGVLAAIKVWRAQLTAAEIQTEMRQMAPFRTANLQMYYPFFSTASDELDYYTGGQTLTITGTPEDGDGPPVPYRLFRPRRASYTVSAGAAPRFILGTH